MKTNFPAPRLVKLASTLRSNFRRMGSDNASADDWTLPGTTGSFVSPIDGSFARRLRQVLAIGNPAKHQEPLTWRIAGGSPRAIRVVDQRPASVRALVGR